MTLEETSNYFLALASMLPRIVTQDPSEQSVSKKYCHNPSGAKKRKRKEIKTLAEVADDDEATSEGPKKPKIISVEKVQSLELSELRFRLKMQIQQSRTGRNYDREKLHRRRDKRNAKETEKKAKAKPMAKSINVETSILDDPKAKSKGKKSDKPAGEKMQFSKFETKTKNEVTLQESKKKPKKKNLTKMLEDAKLQKKQLTTLQKATDSKSVDQLQSKAWKKAISMAKGEKQADNPDLIVKTIKRKEQAKKKASKEWTERVGGVKRLQKDKQKKRTSNIENRIKNTGNKGAKPSKGSKSTGSKSGGKSGGKSGAKAKSSGSKSGGSKSSAGKNRTK